MALETQGQASKIKRCIPILEFGGVMKDNVLCLKSNSPYYYQIQMQLYVAGLI